jgi:antirestriction protein ArdC
VATTKQYEAITASLITALERGTVPWRKPWNAPTGTLGLPHNGRTGRAYRGLNTFSLWSAAVGKGYTSQAWLTYNQTKDLGGNVKRGAHSDLVYFWKFEKIQEIDAETRETRTRTIPFLKMYRVFNVEQTEGVKLPRREYAEPVEFDTVEAAQTILDAYLANDGPKLLHNGGDQAYYSPRLDVIALPAKEQFENQNDYYSTAFHEAGHSTGHKSRLERFSENAKLAAFGSEEYSKEELVAEFASTFLCSESGIEDTHVNSAAYIANWLRVLKNDPRMALSAAGQAQRASDYILGATREEE